MYASQIYFCNRVKTLCSSYILKLYEILEIKFHFFKNSTYPKDNFFQDDTHRNMFSLSRENKQKHSASGTLDPIGGGHLLGMVDPDIDTEIFRSLLSRLEYQVTTQNK